MQLWLFNRRNLQQVKCGRVEEIKGDEGDDPNYFMHTYFEGKLNRKCGTWTQTTLLASKCDLIMFRI